MFIVKEIHLKVKSIPMLDTLSLQETLKSQFHSKRNLKTALVVFGSWVTADLKKGVNMSTLKSATIKTNVDLPVPASSSITVELMQLF